MFFMFYMQETKTQVNG